jgi:alanine racemase
MRSAEVYSTWVEIDLQAIERNVRWFCEKTGVQVMAVVKANAYGHGSVPCAFAALRGGAHWCGVARIEEGLDLRRSGIECPILLLGHTPPDRLTQAIENRISIVIWDIRQIASVDAASQKAGQPAHIHLKIDTGMSRLGVQPEQATGLAKQLANVEGLHFEGIFTHFARADEREKGTTELQERRFWGVLAELDAAGMKPQIVHAANSAAALTRPSASFNLVRTGISIYGLHPSPDCTLPAEFRPALVWKTILSQVKSLPAGRGISYGHTYTTGAEERIGTLPVGYADGFRRVAENQVLISGRRVPVVGRVCMDQIMVQLDKVPDAAAGDEVVLIGRQGEEQITAEEVAQRWGTINYEVVCGIGSRVPRVYG